MNAAGFVALLLACLAAWIFSVLPSHRSKPCTHGASSAYAWVDGQGRTHVSKPSTSGCIPR